MAYPFIMPGVTHVGPGALASLGPELQRLQSRKAMLVCDPGIVAAGLAERVLEVLRGENVPAEVFSEVELEPSTDNVEKAAAVIKQGGYDVLIGVGGGSSLDIAKGAAVLATNGGQMRDFIGTEMIPRPGLPTILIPTTAGTGAEATLNAIYALRDEQVKKGVVSRYLRAAVAIVDPELTLGCPPKVTAATGMDALVHAIESFTALKATIQTDLYAVEAMQRIGHSLRRAVAVGSDLEARTEMAWGSFLAGVSLANAGVGAVHALAYPLGGRFHVSHGVANSLLLPYVLRFNIPGHLEKFARVAEALGEPVSNRGLREAAFATLEAVCRLAEDIGIPQHLCEVGVRQEDIDILTAGAVEQTRLLGNNPRSMTREDITRIYTGAL